jgi:elongation factor Ts
MAEITAGLVKALRDKSGVGMMECKKALQETGGDMEAAVDWLRAKGHARAAKKADRIAADGVIALAVRDNAAGMIGALIELNAETDFVARNAAFQDLARQIAAAALAVEGDIEALRAAPITGGATVQDAITNLIATIGENMVLRRATLMGVDAGVIGAYVHPTGDVGRIGVLVALEGEGDKGKLRDLGRKIAMHIAHANPSSLSAEDLDPDVVERERAIFSEQALASGKPPAVVEKMVEGRIRKFYEEVVLLNQAFVMDPGQTIGQLVAEAGVKLTAFARFALGEGVEKESADLASEVAALTRA